MSSCCCDDCEDCSSCCECGRSLRVKLDYDAFDADELGIDPEEEFD